MNPLYEFIPSEYDNDKRELRDIADHLRVVWPLFLERFDQKQGWPYEIASSDKFPQKGISESTCAMVLFAIAAALGRFDFSVLNPKGAKKGASLPQLDFPGLVQRYDEGLRLVKRRIKKKKNKKTWISSSYGEEDVFTTTWLMQLPDRLDENKDQAAEQQNLNGFFLPVAKRVLSRFIKDPERKFRWSEDDPLKRQETNHQFPTLRYTQLWKALSPKLRPELKEEGEVVFAKVAQEAFDLVHRQLSLFGIPNSDFDAAELVFAFETLMVLDDQRAFADTNLTARVFEVLDQSQQRSTYWRPLRPFVITNTGPVHLPLSVEIANSLLRVCCALDEKNPPDSYFTKHLPLFRRYTSWIRSRLVKGDQGIHGWCSEHVMQPSTIHPWETAQVALYLTHYSALLQAHLSKKMLRLANLRPRRPDELGNKVGVNTFKIEPLAGLTSSKTLLPMNRIKTSFIEARRHSDKSNKQHFSILLYGPPGTSKTHTAKSIAKSLSWPLIQLTPSNFIAEGESLVDVRAESIFQTLGEQTKTVIFFDEIDRLLLDRDSPQYGKQSDIFQFSTPGMLTRFNDLHEKAEKNDLIVVIATNYEERIDPAIKRTGRIDDRLLLAPPAKAARRSIIENEVPALRGSVSEQVLKNTALFTYKEIKGLVERAKQSGKPEIGPEIELSSLEFSPEIRIGSYKARFQLSNPDGIAYAQKPFLELFTVILIKGEVSELSCEEMMMLDAAIRLLDVTSSVEEVAANKKMNTSLIKEIKDKGGDDKFIKSLLQTILDNHE